LVLLAIALCGVYIKTIKLELTRISLRKLFPFPLIAYKNKKLTILMMIISVAYNGIYCMVNGKINVERLRHANASCTIPIEYNNLFGFAGKSALM
jgi:hypothetical protein